MPNKNAFSRLISSRFSRRTIAIAVSLLLVAGAATISFFGHAEKTAAAAPPPVTVTVANVIERSVTEWDDFSGRVESIERVEIRPRVSGTIESVHFKDGQLVKKGDLLFTIDQRPYKAELARAEAARAGALARAALARTELDRTRRLIEDRAVAKRELDERENAHQEAEANLKATEAAVQTARLNLQYTEITAPVAGRVSRAEITVGNLVGNGGTAPVLTTVVSVSPVYVNFEVDEPTYIRYASAGTAGNSGVQRIPVAIGLTSEAGYPRIGHVQSFDNRLDTGSGTIRVRAVFDNADGTLMPGMYARVRTGDANTKNALLIDDRAVGTDQDKKYVIVVGEDNKAVYRQVVLGPMTEGLRVVRDGLKKDERIVVNGLQRIRPNDTVNPEAVAMDARVAGLQDIGPAKPAQVAVPVQAKAEQATSAQ